MPCKPSLIVHSLALSLLFAGCASTASNTEPTRHAANNTPAQNREIARSMIATEYTQWDRPSELQCLDDLWQAESHWNHRATNPRTGACGIPQSYPCQKMATQGRVYGLDYRRNPWPQIAWGLAYIDERYGSPCAAWRRFKRGGGY